MLQGERSLARDNRTMGRFHLTGLPPAQRGLPQIEVTFDIDANGIVSVMATDKATGKEQKITISGASGLAKDEVNRLVKEAEANAAEDARQREEIEARNKADAEAYQAAQAAKAAPSRRRNRRTRPTPPRTAKSSTPNSRRRSRSDMSIVRFDPFADLLTNGRWVPAVDIFENGKQELVLKAELPDMKREDIQVVFENNTLTLKGERKFEGEREAGAVPPRRACVWHVQPVVLAAVDGRCHAASPPNTRTAC